MPRKIVVVVGTRPEAIKLLPVYLKLLDAPTVEPVLLSTGQHKEMLYQIFEAYQVRPDFDLDVMKDVTNLSTLTGHLFLTLDTFVEEHKPDVLIVQGDTTSAMVGAMVGFYRKTTVAHVEAGLRTHDKFSPFPEEVNRQIIGKVADLHFAPTEIAAKNLEKENICNIDVVGNTVIDSLLYIRKKIDADPERYFEKFKGIDFENKDLMLVTSHRRENHGEGLENICSAISSLAQKYHHTCWVFPVHLNPQVKEVVHKLLGNQANIFLLPPLNYDDLVFFMSRAKLILTDSGGIQEEAPTCNVPILVLRDTTERPEGIEAGCALLVGTDKEDIISAFERIYNDRDTYTKMSSIPNPYGDGNSSERIVKVLLRHE